MAAAHRNRILITLALLFFGPLLLAIIAYFGPWGWSPLAAHGELVDPPRAVPAAAALAAGAETGRWSLIYVRLEPCAEQCLEQLARLRRVRLALGHDAARVELVAYLTGRGASAARNAGFAVVNADAAGAGPAVDALAGAAAIRDGRIYIADPLDNLVMGYPPDAEQQGLLEDLERLLELSRIG